MVSDWDVIETDQPAGKATIQDCSEVQDGSDTETLGTGTNQEHEPLLMLELGILTLHKCVE